MAVEVTPAGPTEDVRPVRRALVSVFDKTGLQDLVRGLHDAGVGLVSTGGSAALIEGLGLPVTKVEDLTGFPECLEGRVKTLHPMVHAGLLADTRKPDHLAQLVELGVEPFDLVVVNLYPFAATVASGAPADQVVENIDIGGPSMVRAAAKNHPSVAVVTDPTAYASVLEAVRSGGFTFEQRKALAAQAFVHTATYDVHVASWMGNAYTDSSEGTGFPAWVGATWTTATGLRYGENPHQAAALYVNGFQPHPGLAQAEQMHGKEMSYNNYIDTDAAVRASLDHGDQPTVAIIKHANPCGIAVGADIESAYAAAHSCDPVSAYGGIVASNHPVTAYPDVADVPETEVTFVGNSLLKARAVAAATGVPALADDSGLTVDVLGGAPGVFSARWSGSRAGEGASRQDKDRANLTLLLEQVADVPDEHRGAAFACAAVLALPDGRYAAAEGRVPGHLERVPRGENGFGYDPVFVPDGQDGARVRTLAEYTDVEKNAISHRGRAFRALAPSLRELLT